MTRSNLGRDGTDYSGPKKSFKCISDLRELSVLPVDPVWTNQELDSGVTVKKVFFCNYFVL